MKVLVLGGTVFLSRAVAEHAVAAGHDVTCAARGTSGTVPPGARLVTWDRDDEVPAALAAESFDAVVDVARRPSWVRRAVAAFADAHQVLVSTISVYTDDATPGGTPQTLPVHEPAPDDDGDYGPAKVACEQAVTAAGEASWVVVRPGLVVGPGDPSGRFAYWPRRLAAGGRVLAPGRPGDRVQVIDVRDLAAWLVLACEQRLTGTFDATGPATTFAELLSAVSPDAALTWVADDFLAEQGVEPWSGPASVPLWLPRPAYDGMLDHDVSASLAAGLAPRPLADTARDTLAWLEATPDAVVTGIDLARERELLAAWDQDPRS